MSHPPFRRLHGKNNAWSATAYNKRARVGKMRQGKTLDSDEEELIDNHVRFDMTAHRPKAILEIIVATRSASCSSTAARRSRRSLRHSRTKEFLVEDPGADCALARVCR